MSSPLLITGSQLSGRKRKHLFAVCLCIVTQFSNAINGHYLFAEFCSIICIPSNAVPVWRSCPLCWPLTCSSTCIQPFYLSALDFCFSCASWNCSKAMQSLQVFPLKWRPLRRLNLEPPPAITTSFPEDKLNQADLLTLCECH